MNFWQKMTMKSIRYHTLSLRASVRSVAIHENLNYAWIYELLWNATKFPSFHSNKFFSKGIFSALKLLKLAMRPFAVRSM